MPNRRSILRRREDHSPSHVFAKVLKVSATIAGIVLALGIGYLVASLFIRLRDLPDVTAAERFEPIEAIQIFDRYDHLVCTVEGDEDRRVVSLNEIAPQMQHAILAAEDHHFFEHHGINVMSILRAFVVNLQAGHVVEGGSTITQQLAKNLFFSDAGRTVDRKVKEALVAWELERRYPKERILEMYLNQVYFGNNAYGIERAAFRYFDTSASKLNLAQAAFLAGLVKAPSELGTIANRPAALIRQKEILDKMVEYGYITEHQAKMANGTKLAFKHGLNPLQRYPYYISYVLQLLHEKFSQAEMRRQGLRVYTNLDPKAQEIAENTLAEAMKHAPKGVSQEALVSLAVPNGAILALVGGVGNFWHNQFNRATNPHTVGSSFKPFVYLTAFLKGIANPDSYVDDKPLVIHQLWGLPDYAPKNFDKKFLGHITIRKALALSRNIPAVRTAQLAGIDSIVETARQAGIKARLDANLSLALGSSAVSPLEMAAAYSTFARDGVAIEPQALRRIENNRGEVIEIFEPKANKVFPSEPVAELLDVMQDVVKYGTGTQAKLLDRPVAGKTGTADEGKDIWFIGFTTDLVTAVWGGNDENLPIPGTNVTGGVVMAKVWRAFNMAYYEAYPSPAGAFVAPNPSVPPSKDQPPAEKLVHESKPTTPLTPLTPQTPTIDNSLGTQTSNTSQETTASKATENSNATSSTISTSLDAKPLNKIEIDPKSSADQSLSSPTTQRLLPVPNASNKIPAVAPQILIKQEPRVEPKTAPSFNSNVPNNETNAPNVPMRLPDQSFAGHRLYPLGYDTKKESLPTAGNSN